MINLLMREIECNLFCYALAKQDISSAFECTKGIFRSGLDLKSRCVNLRKVFGLTAKIALLCIPLIYKIAIRLTPSKTLCSAIQGRLYGLRFVHEDVVLEAIKKRVSASDRGVSKYTMCINEEFALDFTYKNLPNGKNIALKALKEDGLLLSCSDGLQEDREAVLAAVSQNGLALIHAGSNLSEDKDIALAAVSQNGLVLKFVSEDLEKDKDITLAAVSQDGLALKFASEDLQKDIEVAAIAVRQNKKAMQFVKDLQVGEVERFAHSNNDMQTVIDSIN